MQEQRGDNEATLLKQHEIEPNGWNWVALFIRGTCWRLEELLIRMRPVNCFRYVPYQLRRLLFV